MIEVIRIVNGQLAEARVSRMAKPAAIRGRANAEDPKYWTEGSQQFQQAANLAPIQPGDFLFNPLWDPNKKTYIALLGWFDLNGDGVEDGEVLREMLRDLGAEIDAYFDWKTMQFVRKLEHRTNYLILSEVDAASLVARGALRPDEQQNGGAAPDPNQGNGGFGPFYLASPILSVLESDGVPATVVAKLKELSGKQFEDEKAFIAALEEKLVSKEELARYGSTIWFHTQDPRYKDLRTVSNYRRAAEMFKRDANAKGVENVQLGPFLVRMGYHADRLPSPKFDALPAAPAQPPAGMQ
jgi:hypothetical protein